MSDEVFLILFKYFPLCRDFNVSQRDHVLDLRFCETIPLKYLAASQSSILDNAKSAATRVIYFLAGVLQSETT